MTILNSIISIFLIVLIQINISAQEVSDFTITSVDTVEYTLYDYLDNGTPVVLDMFSRY